ncbi:hypothetical protein D3C85_1195370 [compost metagenome]
MAATTTAPDGFIPPRLTRSQLIAKTGYGTDQLGAMVYVTDLSGTTNAATANVIQTGYYTFTGSVWKAMVSKVSAYVNAGVDVSLGNINVRLATGLNKSLEIAFTNAVTRVSGTSINNYVTGTGSAGGSASTTNGYLRQSSATTIWTAGTYVAWQPNRSFTDHGSSQEIILNDEINKISYKITLIVGVSYNNNLISIEVL